MNLQQLADATEAEFLEQAEELDIDLSEYTYNEHHINAGEINHDDLKEAVINEFIDQNFSDAYYDTESMQFDYTNNNCNDPEEYRHETIVRNSLINGQKKQAEEQCKSFGLCFGEQYHAYKTELGQ